ncbi:hypothetical protein BC835DRAFT_1536195 [Cytidiella melzeri]|nr:hypothetical protein BC835DRAFT_1536195 [Cytidiella melzeri]
MTKGTARRKNAKLLLQIHSQASTDPAENTQLLTDQLRGLGLYAASTLGDGNCLFRALSDQLYGTDTAHSKLRQEICNWIEAHNVRYEPFVDDERGLAVHLQCMRQQGTYGGHLELSAFAHMTKRNVKVIQPGLVYVIEWDAGGENQLEETGSPSTLQRNEGEEDHDLHTKTRRERKRLERERTSILPPVPQPSEASASIPIYVAYHDWEHFSSIRNLRGPHSGLPNVLESPAPDDSDSARVPVSPVRKKPASSARLVGSSKVKRKPDSKRTLSSHSQAITLPLTPSQVPLPISRSPSPSPEELSTISPIPYPLPQSPPSPSRIYRSPKRTFDESSASSESSQSQTKRAKSSKPTSGVSRLNPDFDIDTPSLTISRPGSPSSLSSLSSLSSPESTPPPEQHEQPRPPSPLTQRQRKQRGVPKPRVATAAAAKAAAGKIVIPGGRFKRSGVAPSKPPSHAGSEGGEEWQRNGTGRLDVRGFRELKI